MRTRILALLLLCGLISLNCDDREYRDHRERTLRVYHVVGGRQVWGLTARLIQNLLARLGMGGMPESPE